MLKKGDKDPVQDVQASLKQWFDNYLKDPSAIKPAAAKEDAPKKEEEKKDEAKKPAKEEEKKEVKKAEDEKKEAGKKKAVEKIKDAATPKNEEETLVKEINSAMSELTG